MNKPTTLSEVAQLMEKADQLAQLFENERYELEDAERDARRAAEALKQALEGLAKHSREASLKALSIRDDLNTACSLMDRLLRAEGIVPEQPDEAPPF